LAAGLWRKAGRLEQDFDMAFDLKRSLRRLKPGARIHALRQRSDASLTFVTAATRQHAIS